jgi:plasmid replication initiation protein
MKTGIDWLDKKTEEALAKTQAKNLVIERVREDEPVALPTIYGYEGEVNISRTLVKAAHGLNLSQKRLIMYAVSRIHPHVKQPNQLVVKVNAQDYAREMGVLTNHAYRDLQEASDNLFNRYISMAYETPTGKEIQKIHWVSSAKYHTGEGWVELRFTPEVSPYLSMLNEGNQIIYNLQTVMDLKSVYTWRLLELLLQWPDTKRLLITLDDYRHALEIPETYRYVDVRLHCIEKPILELSHTVGMEISWKPIKDKENRRKVGALEFQWKPVEQLQINLEGGKKESVKRKRKAA